MTLKEMTPPKDKKKFNVNYSLQLKVRWHVMGCINHDIVIYICSQLLMRLSYYFHPGYGKKNWSLMRIEPPECEPSTLPLDQSANSFID